MTTLKTRPLGKTELQTTELAIGTWGLSGDGYGKVEHGEAEKVLSRAFEIGFALVETADCYGAGSIETLLGNLLPSHPDVLIVTKGGTDLAGHPKRKRFDPAFIRSSMEQSLKRLRRDVIDVYLLHNPSSYALLQEETIDALNSLQREGMIKRWGVSAGSAEVARTAIERGAEVLELEYNLFHGRDLHAIAGDVMVAGVGVLARSTLHYGLLAGRWGADHRFEEGDHRNNRWSSDELARRIDQLSAVRFLVKRDVLTLRGAAVRFVLANHLVSSAILAPRSVAQLEQLVREVGAGPSYLPEDDLRALPAALQRVGIES